MTCAVKTPVNVNNNNNNNNNSSSWIENLFWLFITCAIKTTITGGGGGGDGDGDDDNNNSGRDFPLHFPAILRMYCVWFPMHALFPSKLDSPP
jgi:hypothetical protein